MHPVVVDKQLNLDDCGVCTCLEIYCLVYGLDYRTMPTFLFANQACIFVYYTVMGYQFDHEESYNSALDEVLGASAIVDYDAPPINYRDDANRHERGQRTLAGTNPPPLPQVTAEYLRFLNEEGEISFTDDEDDDPNNEDYTDDTPKNLANTLNQEHTITAVLGLTDMANAMATQEEQILKEEDNYGAMNVQVNETEGVDNIDELKQELPNQMADVEHHIRMLQEANDNSTATDSNTVTDSNTELKFNSNRGITISEATISMTE
jgi:hypothetical protein